MLFRDFVPNIWRCLNRIESVRPFCDARKLPVVLANKVEDLTDRKVDKLFSKVGIEIRGHDPAVLNSFMKFMIMSCKELDLKRTRVYSPHYIRWNQWTLRSSFAHKKVKLHYETRTYRRLVTILEVTGSTASTFLEYFQRNIPEGVAMREIRPLPQPLLNMNYSSANNKADSKV